MALRVDRLPLQHCGINMLNLDPHVQILNAEMDHRDGNLFVYFLYDDSIGFLGSKNQYIFVAIPGYEIGYTLDDLKLELIGYVPSDSKSLARTHIFRVVSDV